MIFSAPGTRLKVGRFQELSCGGTKRCATTVSWRVPLRGLAPALRTLGSRSARHQNTAGTSKVEASLMDYFQICGSRPTTTDTQHGALRLGSARPDTCLDGTPGYTRRGDILETPSATRDMTMRGTGYDMTDQTDSAPRLLRLRSTLAWHPQGRTASKIRPVDTRHEKSARNRISGLTTLSGRPGSCCAKTSAEAAAGLHRRP